VQGWGASDGAVVTFATGAIPLELHGDFVSDTCLPDVSMGHLDETERLSRSGISTGDCTQDTSPAVSGVSSPGPPTLKVPSRRIDDSGIGSTVFVRFRVVDTGRGMDAAARTAVLYSAELGREVDQPSRLPSGLRVSAALVREMGGRMVIKTCEV
jgi:hypothetical protein